MGGIRWGVGQSFPLIDTAGVISIKQQRWPGGQKTAASSEVVYAFFFNGVEFLEVMGSWTCGFPFSCV